jgi:hypothetical protein
MSPPYPRPIMTASTKSYRYQLPQKAIKGDCPGCGHRRTLSRYVDTRTGEPLPEPYGRCDRESNCSYHLSPYHKGPTGLSYAEEMNPNTLSAPIPKSWFRLAGKQKHNGISRSGLIQTLIQMEGATAEQAERVAAFIFDKPKIAPIAPPPIYTIPDEVFQASLGHYERNQFARLLSRHFGEPKALELLTRYQIGTSSRWPGACVFWYIDEQNRIRGGQIKLFDESFHTAKYVDANGQTRSKTSWVHSALAHKLDEQKEPYPDWLTAYLDERNAVEKSPCLFGLPQLASAPSDLPIAVVEAPKTAVVCTAYLPGFLWLAVGALSYLNAERLAPLRGRSIMLFPDLSKDGTAFARWSRVADELRPKGFQISVSTYLEDNASEAEKVKGLDLADYLLRPTPAADESGQRIEEPVRLDEQPVQASSRLPRLLEHYWTLFTRPPLWWNKIAAHKALLRCLEPAEEVEPTIVQTLAEQLENPGSILRPDESAIDRQCIVPEVTEHYPTDWDEPTQPGSVPTIIKHSAADYFQWQRECPPFNQLGLASLNLKLI